MDPPNEASPKNLLHSSLSFTDAINVLCTKSFHEMGEDFLKTVETKIRGDPTTLMLFNQENQEKRNIDKSFTPKQESTKEEGKSLDSLDEDPNINKPNINITKEDKDLEVKQTQDDDDDKIQDSIESRKEITSGNKVLDRVEMEEKPKELETIDKNLPNPTNLINSQDLREVPTLFEKKRLPESETHNVTYPGDKDEKMDHEIEQPAFFPIYPPIHDMTHSDTYPEIDQLKADDFLAENTSDFESYYNETNNSEMHGEIKIADKCDLKWDNKDFEPSGKKALESPSSSPKIDLKSHHPRLTIDPLLSPITLSSSKSSFTAAHTEIKAQSSILTKDSEEKFTSPYTPPPKPLNKERENQYLNQNEDQQDKYDRRSDCVNKKDVENRINTHETIESIKTYKNQYNFELELQKCQSENSSLQQKVLDYMKRQEELETDKKDHESKWVNFQKQQEISKRKQDALLKKKEKEIEILKEEEMRLKNELLILYRNKADLISDYEKSEARAMFLQQALKELKSNTKKMACSPRNKLKKNSEQKLISQYLKNSTHCKNENESLSSSESVNSSKTSLKENNHLLLKQNQARVTKDKNKIEQESVEDILLMEAVEQAEENLQYNNSYEAGNKSTRKRSLEHDPYENKSPNCIDNKGPRLKESLRSKNQILQSNQLSYNPNQTFPVNQTSKVDPPFSGRKNISGSALRFPYNSHSNTSLGENKKQNISAEQSSYSPNLNFKITNNLNSCDPNGSISKPSKSSYNITEEFFASIEKEENSNGHGNIVASGSSSSPWNRTSPYFPQYPSKNTSYSSNGNTRYGQCQGKQYQKNFIPRDIVNARKNGMVTRMPTIGRQVWKQNR